jgi:hypothetical protein
VLSDVLQDRQIIDLRHIVIGHNGVIASLAQLGQSGPAIPGRFHGVPVSFQIRLQQAPEGRIIVHQENAFSNHRGLLLSSHPSRLRKADPLGATNNPALAADVSHGLARMVQFSGSRST